MNNEIPTDDLITNVAGGLAGRIRSMVAVLDRLDRLEAGSGTWRDTFNDEELPEAATEVTLRALRTVANPTHLALLKELTAGGSCAVSHLIEITGLGRLVVSEQLNDLVQVGLAIRLIDTDHAQITAAGASLVQLVETLIAGVAEQYRAVDK